MSSLNSINTSKINNFTYSTHEKENDFGIGVFDAHARVYDPITPRFWQIDVMSEKWNMVSPFSYSNNNPIRFTDPDGMMAVECCDNLPTARSTSDATYIAQGTPVSLTMPRGQATPAFSLTITAGKQANVQVGSFGLEANLGAREIFSTSSFGERTAPANTTVTTSGFSASYGAGTIGAEKKVTTTQGEMSIPTVIAGLSMKTLATTTTEYTSNMGAGLGKTGLSANLEGGKTTTSYLLPSGITTAPTVTGRNTTASIGGSDMRPGTGGTTKGGTTFSIGFGVKVEVKIDLKQAWENVKKYGL